MCVYMHACGCLNDQVSLEWPSVCVAKSLQVSGWTDMVACICMWYCVVCACAWARGHPQLCVCVSTDVCACVPCTGGGELLGARVTTHTAMVSDGCARLRNRMSISQWAGSPLSVVYLWGKWGWGAGGLWLPRPWSLSSRAMLSSILCM